MSLPPTQPKKLQNPVSQLYGLYGIPPESTHSGSFSSFQSHLPPACPPSEPPCQKPGVQPSRTALTKGGLKLSPDAARSNTQSTGPRASHPATSGSCTS